MKDKKKLLLSIGLVLVLVIMIVGISYAAFKFVGEGSIKYQLSLLVL